MTAVQRGLLGALTREDAGHEEESGDEETGTDGHGRSG
jgi:hypothetical protein